MLFHRKTESERLDNMKALLTLSEVSYTHMKRVNNYFREHGTALGCPGVTFDAANIIDDRIKKGESLDGLPYSEHDVLHEYYEIQRLQQDIMELEDVLKRRQQHG